MSVKERLKRFLKESNIQNVEFERNIGVANGYINSISKGIGAEKIAIIIEKFPNLNTEWLLTGKGEMYRTYPKVEETNVNLNEDSNECISYSSVKTRITHIIEQLLDHEITKKEAVKQLIELK